MTTQSNQRHNAHAIFQQGQKGNAIVAQLPDKQSDRLLLVCDLNSALSSYTKTRATVSFIDSTLEKMSDIQPDKLIQVKVKGVSDNTHLDVLIGEMNGNIEITGQVHISQIIDPLHVRAGKSSSPKSPLFPLESYRSRVGEIITARILQVQYEKDKKANGGSKKIPQIKHISLSVRPSQLQSSGASQYPLLTLHSCRVGDVSQCYVHNVDDADLSIWVEIAPGFKGKIINTEHLHKEFTQEEKEKFINTYQAGQALTAQITKLHIDKHYVEMSLLPLGSKPSKSPAASTVSVTPNSLVSGRIVRIDEHGLRVQLDAQQYGFIHVCDIADEWSKDILQQFKVGQFIDKAYVLSVTRREKKSASVQSSVDDDQQPSSKKQKTDAANTYLEICLSIRPSRINAKSKVHSKVSSSFPEITSLDQLKEEQLLQGYVKHVTNKGVFIWINRQLYGRVQLKNLADVFVTDVAAHFPVGKFIRAARVTSIDRETGHIELNLRKSVTKVEDTEANKYTFDNVTVGQKLKGVITQIKSFGIFIQIKHSNLSGLCHISEVSDTFISDLSHHYSIGDRVLCCIVKKDDAKHTISLGLKHKYFATSPDAQSDEQHQSDEEEGQLKGDPWAGKEKPKRNRKKQANKENDGEQNGVASDQSENDQDDEAQEADSDEMSDDESSSSASSDDAGMDESRPSKKAKVNSDSTPSSLSLINPSLMHDDDMEDAPPLAVTPLQILAKLQSKRDDDEEEDDTNEFDDESDDEGTGVNKKLSRRAKAAAKKREEKSLLQKETDLLADSQHADTADDYERLLAQSPNSSLLWVKYMAFQISLTEIDAARNIARRALKAISFRMEREKLNVWIALLNLENLYGTNESLQTVLNDAIKFNEPLVVYLELAKIYSGTNKHDLVVETYETCVKKFANNPLTWTSYGLYHYKQGQPNAARDILKRALQRIDSQQHIPIICKFAQYEFSEHGSIERGRTLFEGVMSNYPKRVDLWNIYLDMELKLVKQMHALQPNKKDHNQDTVRRLFDRITSLNISSKKMKFFFKRYLAYEREYGDEQHIDVVKNKAKEYVSSKIKE